MKRWILLLVLAAACGRGVEPDDWNGPDSGVANPDWPKCAASGDCKWGEKCVPDLGECTRNVAGVDLDSPSPDLPPGRYVRLRVRDDGAGMDGPTLARIFEPYMTTKGPFGSHGLGLPVVHGIVTAAGGAVRVESAPGRGSTFDVYLPWRAPPG